MSYQCDFWPNFPFCFLAEFDQLFDVEQQDGAKPPGSTGDQHKLRREHQGAIVQCPQYRAWDGDFRAVLHGRVLGDWQRRQLHAWHAFRRAVAVDTDRHQTARAYHQRPAGQGEVLYEVSSPRCRCFTEKKLHAFVTQYPLTLDMKKKHIAAIYWILGEVSSPRCRWLSEKKHLHRLRCRMSFNYGHKDFRDSSEIVGVSG